MSPVERTTRMPAPDHPPCPQRCWTDLGGGWVLKVSSRWACRWDETLKRWTECEERK